jgi:hypothetical protein
MAPRERRRAHASKEYEYEFTLPIGYRDGEGTLHRHGVMRLATTGDEILPLKDHRVQANLLSDGPGTGARRGAAGRSISSIPR